MIFFLSFYLDFFGVEMCEDEGNLFCVLLFVDYFVGNVVLLVLYGGVVGVFFEICVIFELFCVWGEDNLIWEECGVYLKMILFIVQYL